MVKSAVAAPAASTLDKFKLDSSLLEPTAVEEKIIDLNDGNPKDEFEVVALSTEEQEALAVEVASIDAAVEALTERKEQIKAIVRKHFDYGTVTLHQEAGVKVTVGHNPIFNEAKFTVAYPYDYSEVQKVVEVDKRGRDVVVEKLVFPNRRYYKITPDRNELKLIENYKELFFDEGEKKVGFK